MAKVENNIITKGLRGKVGNLVFRKRGKKTTAYVMSERKKPLTIKQEEAQARFAAAVSLAQKAISNEEGLAHFKEMARKKKKESAYSAAVSYFMKNGIHG